VTRGKVTFVAIGSISTDPFPWPATKAVAEADVIWTISRAPTELLQHAPVHADIIAAENAPIHSVLPFFDLASRDGFHVTRILSDDDAGADLLEQVDRCRELGLEPEIVRCR
jgi:precorrin-4 methylase